MGSSLSSTTRAAIDARKSNSQDVGDEAKSVTRQIAGAREFIASRGWSLDEGHVYVDDGVSGALFANRIEFQKMMRGAAAHGRVNGAALSRCSIALPAK
jgi:DNA invertase Pin-like site-specific DNA recombinase